MDPHLYWEPVLCIFWVVRPSVLFFMVGYWIGSWLVLWSVLGLSDGFVFILLLWLGGFFSVGPSVWLGGYPSVELSVWSWVWTGTLDTFWCLFCSIFGLFWSACIGLLSNMGFTGALPLDSFRP